MTAEIATHCSGEYLSKEWPTVHAKHLQTPLEATLPWQKSHYAKGIVRELVKAFEGVFHCKTLNLWDTMRFYEQLKIQITLGTYRHRHAHTIPSKSLLPGLLASRMVDAMATRPSLMICYHFQKRNADALRHFPSQPLRRDWDLAATGPRSW